jgi:hypothetical protein
MINPFLNFTIPLQESTFMLYNRITIKGETGSTGKQPAPPPPQTPDDGKKDKKKTDQKNRESAVWYEYGCV